MTYSLRTIPNYAAKIVFECNWFYLNDNSILRREKQTLCKTRNELDDLFEITEMLVLPESVLNDVLHAYHDSAHFGIARLAEILRGKFYFEKLFKRVGDFVKNCHICAKGKFNLPPSSGTWPDTSGNKVRANLQCRPRVGPVIDYKR